MGEHTVFNLLFPNTILIVDKTVPLDIIAQTDQVIPHLLKVVLGDQALAWAQLARLHEVFLRLKGAQPCVIEVVP